MTGERVSPSRQARYLFLIVALIHVASVCFGALVSFEIGVPSNLGLNFAQVPKNLNDRAALLVAIFIASHVIVGIAAGYLVWKPSRIGAGCLVAAEVVLGLLLAYAYQIDFALVPVSAAVLSYFALHKLEMRSITPSH